MANIIEGKGFFVNVNNVARILHSNHCKRNGIKEVVFLTRRILIEKQRAQCGLDNLIVVQRIITD